MSTITRRQDTFSGLMLSSSVEPGGNVFLISASVLFVTGLSVAAPRSAGLLDTKTLDATVVAPVRSSGSCPGLPDLGGGWSSRLRTSSVC